MRAAFPIQIRQLAVVSLVATAGFILGAVQPAFSQVTQMYSFEPGLEGFGPNGGNFTTTLNTDPDFASEGTNSLKVEYGPFGTFSGAVTGELRPEFGNPPGVDFIRFDFINPTRYVPEEPVGGVDPTFCDVGVTVFGVDPADPNTGLSVQFLATQESLGSLDPGTHDIEIDLSQGGIGPEGVIKSFNGWFGSDPGQLTPTGFQLYFNKNFGVTPNFGWTFYLDNIRVGQIVEGDYNGNGSVDAADYTVWRDNLGLMGGATVSQGDGNGDGNVTQADYVFWKDRFGNPAGGGSLVATAVPEPTSALLLMGIAVTAFGCVRCRMGRSTRD